MNEIVLFSLNNFNTTILNKNNLFEIFQEFEFFNSTKFDPYS